MQRDVEKEEERHGKIGASQSLHAVREGSGYHPKEANRGASHVTSIPWHQSLKQVLHPLDFVQDILSRPKSYHY